MRRNYDKVQKQTVLNFHEIKILDYNITPTLHLQDEFDVALENIIFEPKKIFIVKGNKNYGVELSAHFTNIY